MKKNHGLLAMLILAVALSGCGVGSSGGGGGTTTQYTLTIAVEGAGTVTPASGSAYAAGTVVTLVPIAGTGYAFDRWAGPDGASVVTNAETGAHTIEMDGNKSITAVFAKLSYELTVAVSPAGAGTVTEELVTRKTAYNYGDEVQLTAAANAGYAFDHWEGDLSGSSNPAMLTVDKAKTVTAVFTVPVSITESLVPGAAGLEVTYPYYMAQTEVTYQTWSAVKTWATAHGYTFARPGSCGGYYNASTWTDGTYDSGHDTDPVTEITWRDAIVWCNALTEYYNAYHGTNYDCAYKSGGVPIRDSQNNTNVIDNLVDDGHTATGFRLPTEAEWYLAARYIDGSNWTPDDYASGATAAYTDAAATQAVAWYWANSNVPDADVYTTHPVGQKTPNALGIYDMSGNVYEFCFDPFEDGGRKVRGGHWRDAAINLRIGINNTYNYPNEYSNLLGFRPVRTK